MVFEIFAYLLLKFLESHFQTFETIGKEKRNPENTAKSNSKSVLAAIVKEANCSICKSKEHQIFGCKEFLNKTPSERIQIVSKLNLCKNCLKKGHFSKKCKSRNCSKCQGKHNTLLHLEKIQNISNTSSKKVESDSTNSSTEIQKDDNKATLIANTSAYSNQILLSTVKLFIGSESDLTLCRAILDCGSQVNLLTEKLVKKLGLKSKAESIKLQGIGNTAHQNTTKKVKVFLQSRVNDYALNLEAHILPQITLDQPSQNIDISRFPVMIRGYAYHTIIHFMETFRIIFSTCTLFKCNRMLHNKNISVMKNFFPRKHKTNKK